MIMIERIHLTILYSIEQHGSLTAAAEQLCLTQSALSHCIKKLEQQTGVCLWQKRGRQLQLTQAGRFLLQEAQRLLPQLQRIDDKLLQFAKGEQGSLRIGMECHPCYQWLLQVVNPFLQQWPGIDVDVTQDCQFEGIAALFNYEIDMLVTPDPIQRQGIQFVPVMAYEQVLVVAASHPLAAHPYVTANALNDEVLYTYPVSAERLDIYKEFLTPAGCLPLKRKICEATQMQLQLVAAGRGVAALPKWLAEQHSGVKTLSLGKKGVHKHIHLGLRDNDLAQGYIQGFLDLAQRGLC